MNRELLVKILLWYNVLSLGIWVGGTLFQMLVVVPIWSESPPETVTAFWKGTAYARTILHFFGPVTMALRVLPLLALLVAGWSVATVRPWVLACVATVAVGLVMTLAVIYPINDVLFFGGDHLAADEVRELATRWIWLDRARFAIMSGGYLCLLRAFSLAGASGR
jgi:hypothetical protein